MAQNNRVNESDSYSSIGGTNAPLDTSSDYDTITTSTPTSTTGSKLNEATSGVKATLCVHRTGEKLSSEFNSDVNPTFHEGGGGVKNELVVNEGVDEMMTGEFSHATKNREGVVPGDYERRWP